MWKHPRCLKHLPLVHFISVAGRQNVSLFIELYLHVYDNNKLVCKMSLEKDMNKKNQKKKRGTQRVAVRRENLRSEERSVSE